MRKAKLFLVILALLLAVVMTGTIGLYGWFRLSHVKVNDQIYDLNMETLDLRGQNVPAEEYEELKRKLPRTHVLWDAPFQGNWYPLDTESLTVTEIAEEDFDSFRYFTALKFIDATECTDYEMIAKLQQALPECQVQYAVHLAGKKLSPAVETLNLESGEGSLEELQQALPYLENLKTVTLKNPEIPGADLKALQEAFPEILFTWNKIIGDQEYSMDTEELDFSGSQMTAREAEAYAAYFPKLKTLTMMECPVENEEMAAFRDRARNQFKVIWGVQVGEAYLRSDVTGFIPSNSGWEVSEDDLENLRYCEDLIAVDLGHTGKGNLAWVEGTPHLKYLIMGDGNVFNENITYLSCLKELEYLELFHCPVSDISPLTECTGLRDILLSGTGVINVEPLTKLPELEHVWLRNNGLGASTREYLEQYLPNAVIMVGGGSDHGGGWRDIDRYFKMRDALGMWYMKG